MKRKVLIALVGASVVMSAVTGCSSKKEEGPESLVISDMEVIGESETESEIVMESETDEGESETNVEELSLDLSGEADADEAKQKAEPASESESETESPEKVTVQKSGEAEPQEQTEESDIEKETDTEKEIQKKPDKEKNKNKKPAAGAKPPVQEQSETQGRSETQKQSETQGQSGTQEQSEMQGQSETQKQSETQGQSETQKQSETQDQSETQKQSETQEQSETQKQSETQMQPESGEEDTGELPTEAESETNSEAESETESESETNSEPELLFVNDRVNVRADASEEAGIQALLTPGMYVLAVSKENDWTLIRYEETEQFSQGYVKSEYLSGAQNVRIVKENINVRAEASTDSSKLGEFAGGETVFVTSEKGDWSCIRYTDAEGTVDAYVKTEFLESAGQMEESVKERLINAEVAETKPESETESEAIAEPEPDSEPETESEAITESETDSETEPESEAIAEPETDSETEPESEAITESETDSETEPESEAVTEAESDSETELESESGTVLSEGAQAQFELVQTLFPEVQKAGIIYSESNENAEVLNEEYTALAKEYGLELVTDTIEEELDVDLAASELVGNTDCVFCIEDEMVDGLVQTICAYADEVGIPVIGANEAHVKQGCIAAYADGTLYWNASEAEKLGASYDKIQADRVEEV